MRGKMEIFVCDDRTFDADLVEMYRRYNYNLQFREWIEWKYRENPFGEPILVIARSAGTIAGVQAHIPRDYYAGKRLIRTVEAVDAFVAPAFRRSGVYQRIWSETRRIVKARKLVLITFPSLKSQSIAAMRNEGLKTLGRLDHYTKLLRPEAVLKRKNMRLLGLIYENIFGPFRKLNRYSSGNFVQVTEISRFQHAVPSNQRTIAGERSCDYLNWKFRDSPITGYTCISFSDSGEDIGFAALRPGSEKFMLTIHDCTMIRNVSDCLESLTGYVWNHYPEIGVITFTALESGPLASALKSAGFLRTPSSQVLMLDNIDQHLMPLDPGQWSITRGDSDW